MSIELTNLQPEQSNIKKLKLNNLPSLDSNSQSSKSSQISNIINWILVVYLIIKTLCVIVYGFIYTDKSMGLTIFILILYLLISSGIIYAVYLTKFENIAFWKKSLIYIGVFILSAFLLFCVYAILNTEEGQEKINEEAKKPNAPYYLSFFSSNPAKNSIMGSVNSMIDEKMKKIEDSENKLKIYLDHQAENTKKNIKGVYQTAADQYNKTMLTVGALYRSLINTINTFDSVYKNLAYEFALIRPVIQTVEDLDKAFKPIASFFGVGKHSSCFDPNQILFNGVPIKDTQPGQLINQNKQEQVIAVIKALNKDKLFEFDNVKLTKDHYINLNKNGTNIKVTASEIGIETNYIPEYVVCLITNTGFISFKNNNNNKFYDYFDGINNKSLCWNILRTYYNTGKLTNDPPAIYSSNSKIPLLTQNSLVETMNGVKYIKDIKMGEVLSNDNIVIGVIESLINEPVYELPNKKGWGTGQISILDKDIYKPLSKKNTKRTFEMGYHLITTTHKINMLNNLIISDWEIMVSDDYEKFINC